MDDGQKIKICPEQPGIKEVLKLYVKWFSRAISLGVKYLTLYTFSTENWKRPQKEISMLMRLMVKSLQNETNELNLNNVKITTIGNTESLPNIVQKELEQAKKITENNTQLVLNLAISYSGRWELIEAVKKIARDHANGVIKLSDINEATCLK